MRLIFLIGAGVAIALAVRVEQRLSSSTSPSSTAPLDPQAVAARPVNSSGDRTASAPSAAAAESSTPGAAAAAAAAPADADPLTALPPEDAEWVLEEVARTEQARALSAQEQRELTAQLASVRMHAVLERTEPMAVEPEGAR